MRIPRPNYTNSHDSCCCCGSLLPTPKEGKELTPSKGELGVWQPNPGDPPQWICEECHVRLEKDLRK